jgi:DNA invertase Pin-like site-specific DNA recombinase
MSIQDGTRKITADHTKKLACVYARQSTPRGVKENIVGWQRQREEGIKLAQELGWPKENIRVFDEDHQPLSGTTTEGRYGYLEMLDDVIAGRVGAVLSLEPARVGRDSADWHILIKMCAPTGTLVIDPHGIYDPNDPNDNTKMKIDAVFVEVELRWITQRLQGAKMALAEKGELRRFLPIGYVYDEDNNIILDSDEDVQKMVRLLFTMNRQLGSASKVTQYFNEKDLKFPTLVRGGPRKGTYDWISLSVDRVRSILSNPTYAGTYVFGRSKVKKKAVRKEGEAPKVVKYQENLKRADWMVVIHDAHPAYITWDEFLENETRTRNNRNVPKGEVTGAAREGSALLQGIAICGKCGRRMTVFYPRGASPLYRCVGERVHYGGDTCQVIVGDWIDSAVERAFLDELKPAQIEMSLQALERFEDQAREVDRQWELRLRRVEKAVAEAEDRLLATDYRNKRAYDRVQEDYEGKQTELDLLNRKREEEAKLTLKSLSTEEREAICRLAQDFPRVWNSGHMDIATKKNLLRYLIADVTLNRDDQSARVGIRWKTGAHTSLKVVLLTKPYGPSLPGGVIEFIKELAPNHTDREIAAALNDAGILNGKGGSYTKKRVKRLRRKYEIVRDPLNSSQERREDGRLSSAAVTRMLGMSHGTIHRWCKEGRLDGIQDVPGTHWWIKITLEELAEFEKTIRQHPDAQGTSADTVDLTTVSVSRGRKKEGGPKGVAV